MNDVLTGTSHWSRNKREICALAICFFLVGTVRCAWICDDAYITFRTVDNFVNGYGLTWNPLERTQVYTHPLWMFLMSGAYFVTGEIFCTSLVVSIALSFATILIFTFKITRSAPAALLGVAILSFSKAFLEYSTSGLENPLTHFILILFLWLFLEDKQGLKNLFVLSLLAAIGMVNRMDTILLFFPGVFYAWAKHRSFQGVGVVLAGFLPIILWECFSLFYYGFPFPNTAYAKLSTGIGTTSLAMGGIRYLLNSLDLDPLTLLMILVGTSIPILTRQWKHLPVAAGILLYFIYLIKIGGDFMSGRFLTAPLLAATVLLTRGDFTRHERSTAPFIVVAMILGLSSPYNPWRTDGTYGTNEARTHDARGAIYQHTGLLLHRSPKHPWVEEGLQAKDGQYLPEVYPDPSVVYRGPIGFFGFYAGPEVYIVDKHSLADPLRARLPINDPSSWLPGHFRRDMPEGYYETLLSGVNRIENSGLKEYYNHLTVIQRGPLWRMNRFRTIWNMNLGKYDHLLEQHRMTTSPGLNPIENRE